MLARTCSTLRDVGQGKLGSGTKVSEWAQVGPQPSLPESEPRPPRKSHTNPNLEISDLHSQPRPDRGSDNSCMGPHRHESGARAALESVPGWRCEPDKLGLKTVAFSIVGLLGTLLMPN